MFSDSFDNLKKKTLTKQKMIINQELELTSFTAEGLQAETFAFHFISDLKRVD